MLSEKLTLSLTCLMLIFGLAFYVPSAMAGHGQFDMSLSAAESMIDISSDDGLQITSGRDRATATIEAAQDISLLLTSTQIITIGAGTDPNALMGSEIKIDAYDTQGRSLGPVTGATIAARDGGIPGREFLISLDVSTLNDSDPGTTTDDLTAFNSLGTLLFTIPKEMVERADSGYLLDKRDSDGHGDGKNHSNKHVATFRVDLVDADEGLAAYNPGVTDTLVTAGIPGVVGVDRLDERRASGFIETGAFDVRVILTEEPMGGFTTDHVEVMNGSATAIVKGATLKGTSTAPAQTSELTRDITNYTNMDGSTTGGTLPQPTGRDNRFHTYFVTITPNPGHNGEVRVSIKAFDDKVIPTPNKYVPLSDPQLRATLDTAGGSLTAAQLLVRNSRTANETLTVMVNAAADTTSKEAVAKAAYDKRQKDVLDKVTNEIVLANKTFIPAGGFLVLTADVAKAGIQVSDVKTKDKTGPELLYNTHGLGLPFPADDLDNFFRNGGTLNLGYADIPEATGSDHGDSKGATGNDATGYTAADSTAYTAGALIINEIMWGLDGAGTDDATRRSSQYIELHNPGTAAIGIDNKEWVITVGALPAGYAAIDTVSNNPASGFWEAPGNGGVTVATPIAPTVIDLVSMSRVAGGTDGSMAASWAASMRPSSNLSGRRVGTPGAANNYVMPAAEPTPEPPAPEPMAAVAAADDIMISEVMVASNDGRLPQWIELANVSGAAVSLNGWTLEIENDAADMDVVGAGIEIDLSGVEIGEDQVALVVSKEGRNSSVADRSMGDRDVNQGMLDSNRILDVQAMVSADNARYSLISEMGFMLTLVPPRTAGSAIRASGDSGGNLGMGWDIPMSEDGRSSLIRSDADADMGTDAADWVLASSTNLNGAYRTTYYGSDEDMGTPGYDAGGALPVELSMFDAKRNDAGQVVITWETQSELNNAGFFVKRSQQRNGKFVVINAVMVPGAGTTAEKQSYVYTDHSAQPNVVYYYQIEDVSLDGNRQTLTRGHRLKGHIGAAGKATITWGELKSQE